MKISLTMIVRDEEAALPRCLESAAGLFDEIVIVDTGSRDRTREEALKFTRNVFDFEWADDFSAARNFAISKASGDYIMWLDADDVIPPESREELKNLFSRLETERPDIVMLNYRVGFSGERATLEYPRERIFKNDPAFRFVGEVHEAVPPRGKIIHSPAYIEHRKIKPSDPARNLRILEKKLLRDGFLPPRESYYLARELLSAGRREEAKNWFLRCSRDPSGWLETRISASFELSQLLLDMCEREAADLELSYCLLLGEPRADLCCEMGRRFLEKGDLNAAKLWYLMAPGQYRKRLGGFVPADYGGLVPYLQLCVICDRLGQHDLSEKFNLLAEKIEPGHPSVLANKAYFAAKRGKV